MTDKQTLLDLADKVEGLDGPCRETDAEVWGAVGWNKLFSNTNPPPSFFTSSIDAAVSLVPDGFFTKYISQHQDKTDGTIAFVANVYDGLITIQSENRGMAKTEPLARTAAALRVRAAECES